MAFPQGVLFYDPYDKPLSTAGQVQAGCYRKFFVSGTGYVTLQNVFADGALLTVLSQVPGQAQPSCTADGNGRFNPIYLNPALLYGVQLFSAAGTLLQQTDPYVPKPLEINPVVKPASTSRTSSSLLIDPDLQVAIPGAGTYLVELLIEFDTNSVSGATPGISVAIEYSGTVNTSNAESFAVVGLTSAGIASGYQLNGAAVNYSTGVPFQNVLMYRGVFTATSAGTVALYWGQQNPSVGTPTTVHGGSYMLTQ
jgi:hypothetical protein